MSIYVGTGRINYPAMRGPCPYGYHVPMGTELQSMKDIMTTLGIDTSNGICCKTYLKIPFSGSLYYNTGGWNNEGRGYLLGSTRDDNYPARIQISDTVFSVNAGSNGATSSAKAIRPFKDEPVKPTSSWTTLYDGSSVATGAGIFQNASSGLISLSSDGVNWITMADKNLGATTVYNDGDTLSEANCGKFFQRGNNYPFPFSGASTKSSTLVDASGYGPGNWYYNSTFRTPPSSVPYHWDTSDNKNLRGGVVGAVKVDVKDICVGAGVDDYSPMQGPCPDGFRIPNGFEQTKIFTMGLNMGAWVAGSSGSTDFMTKLHIPKAGCLWENTGNYTSGYGYYWSCSGGSYNTFWDVNNLTSSAGVSNRCHSIRPIKNEPVTPDSTWTTIYSSSGGAGIFWSKGLGLITIKDATNIITIADKNLGANIVYNYGDTLSANNCGGFFQRGNNYMFPFSGASTKSGTQVNATGYGPGNYYNSSTFITATRWDNSANYDLRGNKTGIQKKGNVKQVYVGTTPARPTYNPGIYWNKAKGLISISRDGKNWITIADKNLGAKVVYNDGDTLSQDNVGYFYQRGNNYGFPYNGSVTKSSSQINLNSYGPTNPYYSNTWRNYNGDNWDSSNNGNLWGNTTNTLEARQGPCPTGFHIPTQNEGDILGNYLNGLQASPIPYLKFPPAGGYTYNYAIEQSGNRIAFWTSDGSGSTTYPSRRRYKYYYTSRSSYGFATAIISASTGQPIRPFKNEPVVPDNSRAVLYQPS